MLVRDMKGSGRGSDEVSASKKNADEISTRVADEVDRLLRMSRERNASDLHIEPVGDGYVLRLRLDGVLQDIETLPEDLGKSVIARLKLLADLLTYRSDVPQEGRLRRVDSGDTGDLRVSTFPTIHGERLVIRFFDSARAAFCLEELNFPASVLEGLVRAVSGTSGVVLLTGPAGAGKTTALYAAVNTILRPDSYRPHIVTVEDPVESMLEGVTQTQINPAAGLTFASALRSLLRQDPEVVMVGEIRDRETAEIVAQAGLTGHLVLSTLHGGNIPTVLARLLDMGLEPYVITSAFKAVLAMRLVRVLCSACRGEGERVSVRLSKRTVELTSMTAVGCEECSQTGYAGRRPLVEFVEVSTGLREMILASSDADAIASRLEAEGMRTLVERGCDLVSEGITSIDEIERVCGQLERV